MTTHRFGCLIEINQDERGFVSYSVASEKTKLQLLAGFARVENESPEAILERLIKRIPELLQAPCTNNSAMREGRA